MTRRLPPLCFYAGEQYHYDDFARCYFGPGGKMLTEERVLQLRAVADRLCIVDDKIVGGISDAELARYAKHKPCAYCRGTLGRDSKGTCQGCGAPL